MQTARIPWISQRRGISREVLFGKGWKNRATSTLFALWRGDREAVLAGRLITPSNCETRIAPLYHEVRIVFAAYNYRPKRDPAREGFSIESTLDPPSLVATNASHAADDPRIMSHFCFFDRVAYNALSEENIFSFEVAVLGDLRELGHTDIDYLKRFDNVR